MSQLTRAVLPVQPNHALRIVTPILGIVVLIGLLVYSTLAGNNIGYEDGKAAQRRIDDIEASFVRDNLTACRQDIARLNQPEPIYLPSVEPVRVKLVFGPRNAWPCKPPRSKRLRKDPSNWGYCYRDGH